MKQHITKEQWEELDKYEKAIFLNIDYRKLKGLDKIIFNNSAYRSVLGYPSIGQLIEFLGDVDDKNICWYKGIPIDVDELWEDVKSKLKI